MANRYIPPGREDLYRRQAIADAEVKRLEGEYGAAERRAQALSKALGSDDALVEDAAAEADLLYDKFSQAESDAERIHNERTAGMSAWIDTGTNYPICSACGGTGGPRLAGGGIEDARTSCRTCRGWGREDDGRGHLPVWHEGDQAWYDPATGRRVDVPEPSLDDPPKKNEPPPTARTTGSTGATTMSMVTDGRNLLLKAAQRLDDLAPCVSGPGECEEIGQIQRAEQLEAEAEGKGVQFSATSTPEHIAALAQESIDLANQAKQLRQQAKEGLEARVGNAAANMDTAEQIQNLIRQAAEGTRTGDEMVTSAAGIRNAIDEVKTSTAAAAEMATQRDKTHECLGLIKQAGDHAVVAAGMCGKLRGDIDQYVGVLT